MLIAGIDLGGRTTGKTALTLLNTGNMEVVVFSTSYITGLMNNRESNFIEFIKDLNPEIVGIDAPLSLPDFRSENYLYRNCDKRVKSLSPFSIGEITARGMYIKHSLNCRVVEVYPKTVLEFLGLRSKRYKFDTNYLAEIVEAVRERYRFKIPEFELTGDNVDSLLSVIPVFHLSEGKYFNIGDDTEFIIPC